MPISSATSSHRRVRSENPVVRSATTLSMMSLPTHSVATGMKARAMRSTAIVMVNPRWVSHTSLRSGGTYRSARTRSRQVGSGSGCLERTLGCVMSAAT